MPMITFFNEALCVCVCMWSEHVWDNEKPELAARVHRKTLSVCWMRGGL